MNRILTIIAGAVIFGVLAIGCGGDDADPDADPGSNGGGLGLIAPSDPLTIADARSDDAPDGPLFVRGYLIAVGDELRFCESLAESSPPQCGGESLLVENLDFSEFEGTQTEGEVSWLGEPTELLGTVEGDTFEVGTNILQ
jgi:hypothetical protein